MGGHGDYFDDSNLEGRGRGDSVDGRGMGRGYLDWRIHPEPQQKASVLDDQELADMATSPSKKGDVHMNGLEKNVKKWLAFEQEANNTRAIVPVPTAPVAVDGQHEKEEIAENEEIKDK
jgi:hypothetical protein